MREFNIRNNIGKAMYVVSFHNGEKFHKDNSKFFDVAIFSNKTKLKNFVSELKKQNYLEV
jgi:hypothetical protein